MTKRRGNHFLSMGVNGESFVAVKPPWAQLCHYERPVSAPGCDLAPRRPHRHRGWGMVRPCIPLWSDTSQCCGSPVGSQCSPGGSRAVLECPWLEPGAQGMPQLESLQMGSL